MEEACSQICSLPGSGTCKNIPEEKETDRKDIKHTCKVAEVSP